MLLFPYIAKISSWGLLVVNGIIIVAQFKEISYTDFALTKEGRQQSLIFGATHTRKVREEDI
ncbi:hypothetical protein P6F46_10695 [Bacillus shihchuchen]|uniref:Uncharacterized protein n=1 Tax=Bacillus shihchuchen TaxID=3036942 RepID=A0ABT7KWP5_9BACI|nr:hypothetical protein [Bacillus shihchuchen]